jgi:hypothetical protein
VEISDIAKMGKEFLYRQQSFGIRVLPLQYVGALLEKLFHVAQEQVLFVAIVRIKRSPRHPRALQHLLHGDIAEMFLVHKRHQGIAIYGCIISVFIILGIIIGRLRFDVRGMSAIWFGQALWFMVVGSQLYSRPATLSSPR